LHVKNKSYNNEKNNLLFLDGAKFSKYINAPCDSVRQNVPILQAYRLKYADVEKMNWMIVYR
jgi:hypothetical protein